ncbi:MAG: dTMP kinase [Acidobacteria bacterium]|nr:dTMP kinase [Acidobacteriota bacterium]
MAGIFITFEGIDGCGKTTQLGMLAALLAAHSIPHLITREPGGTLVGNKIREIILDPTHNKLSSKTELLLYAADRAQHVFEELKPSLEKGEIILCDRYTDATIAYQAYGRKLPVKLINQLNLIATDGLAPDLTLLFDLPVEEAEKRMSNPNSLRSKDRLEQEQRDFHQRVRQAYLALAEKFPDRFRTISALGTSQEIFYQVSQVVIPKIKSLYPSLNNYVFC